MTATLKMIQNKMPLFIGFAVFNKKIWTRKKCFQLVTCQLDGCKKEKEFGLTLNNPTDNEFVSLKLYHTVHCT